MAAYIHNLRKSAIRFTSNVIRNERFIRFFNATQRMVFTNVIILRKSEEFIFRKMITRFKNSAPVLSTHRFLFGACLFSWAQDKITDEEINETFKNLTFTTEEASIPTNQGADNDTLPEIPTVKKKNDNKPKTEALCYVTQCAEFVTDEWETVIEAPSSKLWRRKIEGKNLYQYKMMGTFEDISALDFLNVQRDLAYRREWDPFVIKLNVIDREDIVGGCEVVHWVTHYPYPMRHREYIYVRRIKVDRALGRVVMVSKALPNHPDACPPEGLKSENFVRVVEYESTMVIQSHTDVTQNGLTFFLTYYDDPQSHFPRFAYNYLATSGIPEFMEKLHQAAKNLKKENLAEGEIIYY